MASVGTHIKRLRGAKRMTQEELAAQLHVTRQAVSAWETGKSLPDVETLERIAANSPFVLENLRKLRCEEPLEQNDA